MSGRRPGRYFEQRLQACSDRVAAYHAALDRVVQGVATLPEYEMVCRDSVDKALMIATSGLTVVRAARTAGVPGRPRSRHFSRARDILSYKPDEDLPETLVAVWQDTRELAIRPGKFRPRLAAALAYLMVESADGATQRKKIWHSGLPQQLAEETFADYQVAHVQDLLYTWEPLVVEIRRLCAEQGIDGPAPGYFYQVPLSAVADFLLQGLWSSPINGQNRP